MRSFLLVALLTSACASPTAAPAAPATAPAAPLKDPAYWKKFTKNAVVLPCTDTVKVNCVAKPAPAPAAPTAPPAKAEHKPAGKKSKK